MPFEMWRRQAWGIEVPCMYDPEIARHHYTRLLEQWQLGMTIVDIWPDGTLTPTQVLATRDDAVCYNSKEYRWKSPRMSQSKRAAKSN